MSGRFPYLAGRIARSAVSLAVFCISVFILGSCSGKIVQVTRVEREGLFTLSIGKLEDQLDLFQIPGSSSALKTRIFMRDGIFFISNGNSRKIVEFTSYGDLLSMIYNPESNPPPIILKAAVEGDSIASRKAFSYPFRSIGEIAVSSNLDIFVEEKMPPERKVIEESTGALLDEVVLRFSRSGEYRDYLGQEGIGGTPFPHILGLWCTKKDEIVVLSMTQESWQAFWFDSANNLVSALKVERKSLPVPQGEKLIPSLEKIVPDMDSRVLYMKIDYYREAIDPATKTHGGIEFASSFLYSMSPEDGSILGKIDIPAVEKKEDNSFGSSSFERVYEFLGAAAGRNLFFLMPDEADTYNVMILNLGTKTMKKLSISVNREEMYYNAFHLSSDGIISALLASEYDAKVVWWRTEKLIGEPRK